MRILQPAEWSKPRGFSHGVEVGIVLNIVVKLLGEAGAGP